MANGEIEAYSCSNREKGQCGNLDGTMFSNRRTEYSPQEANNNRPEREKNDPNNSHDYSVN